MARTLIVFDDPTRSFRCAGCLGEPYEVRTAVMRDPEAFMAMRERLEADHAECATRLPEVNGRRMRISA